MPQDQTDIVERLLNPPYVEHDGQRLVMDNTVVEALMAEAAEEIKRLREQMEEWAHGNPG